MLAKMLQEQEQAMYMLAGGEAENALWPNFAGCALGQSCQPTTDHHRHVGDVAEDDLGAPLEHQPGDGEQLSDEALALRLQEEELAAQNARFLQMAGIGMRLDAFVAGIISVGTEQPGEELDPAASLSNSEHLSYEVRYP